MNPDELLTGAEVFSLFISVVSIALSIYALYALKSVNDLIDGEYNDPPERSPRMVALGLVWKRDHTGEWYKVCDLCDGNCGQCGITGDVGNRPFNFEKMVKKATGGK